MGKGEQHPKLVELYKEAFPFKEGLASSYADDSLPPRGLTVLGDGSDGDILPRQRGHVTWIESAGVKRGGSGNMKYV